MKRKPSDDAFSKCVRAANDYTCEKCHTKYDKSSTGLHCSHIFSRSNITIRWCKDNAQSLCYACHQWFGGNPADSGVWVEKFKGGGVIELVREKMNNKIKVSKSEEKDIASHYRKELKIIQKKRDNGEVGYIDFVSWQ